MKFYNLLVPIFLFIAGTLHSQTIPDPDRSGLFPFVLPWDDSSPGIANISSWLHKPAGKFGRLRVGSDGHLYAGKERIRLRGVDITYGSCFPTHEEADKIAARMAKFGLNIVRFHCMDQNPYPRGLFERSFKNTRDFEPEALERMDYFISVLEKNGIYIYLCTLNYRPFSARDGLPKEIEMARGFANQGRHVIGFFNPQIIDLQKEFAQKLLTHSNTYTGLRYSEDPAVAFVEINNENGLFQACMGGTGDNIPDPFLTEFKNLWNDWLLARHGSTEKMRKTWGQMGSEPLGKELLANGDFSGAAEPWILERRATAEAEAALSDELPPEIKNGKSIRVNVIRPGTEYWHIRYQQLGLQVEADHPYTLEFWAKADEPRTLAVSVAQNSPPWKILGMQNTANLTKEWKRFRFVSMMGAPDKTARLVFDPQMKSGATWIAGVSLRLGGTFQADPALRLEDKTVAIVKSVGELTPPAQADWLRFLWDTEDRYWKIMNDYFQKDLGVKALILGTIVGTSTPNLMARFDAIDTHAYWQHPHPWNTNDFTVGYGSMVNELGAVLPNLALRKVYGKPFCMTEFGDCSP
ncbi:MAG: carbohydrate binding domain-containing protein, partial [Spirochaetia bacterium]|nr:carbohydrate binding domain-containing protein [Spirochaetia bacterium]